MPTLTKLILDPVSLTLLAIYGTLIVIEISFPARKLPKVTGWVPISLVVFSFYFLLSSYLPLLIDPYLKPFQIANLDDRNSFLGTIFAILIFELLIYIWHKAMHKHKSLWRIFHQMHHSTERLDSFGAFYFSPFDMIGFTLIGSIALNIFVGLSPEATTWFFYSTMVLAIFPHLNINTPQWLGYIIQRPESHSVHHEKGVHAFNYSDLPIFDIIFGTFNNPKTFAKEIGFFDGASRKLPQMLTFQDINSLKSK